MFIDEIGAQNYIFVEPMYDAERVNSLFAQNLYRQIYYTFYGQLASSCAEAGVDLLLQNLVGAKVNRNFPKLFSEMQEMSAPESYRAAVMQFPIWVLM